MHDLVITGGHVVDGTGAPAVRADVAIDGGAVSAIGPDVGPGARTIDATDRVVCPGFIDVHTHYDAQVPWDPLASPSPLHGVTTIIGGNCGFSIAPIATGDADYVMRLMAVVEGIPMGALEGIDWSWSSFGEWLGRLDGRIGPNAAFLVGHSTLRRAVMGDGATRGAASDAQLDAMVALLHACLSEGALGLSSGWDNVHTDGDGNPVPSRLADARELVILAAALREHPGTTLGFFPHMGPLPRDRMEVMADMASAADRPLNWNLLGSMSPTEIYEQQLEACDIAAARGVTVVALAVPDVLRLRANTLLDSLPAFKAVLALDDDARRAAVTDPATRASLRAAVDEAARSDRAAMTSWDLVEIAEPRSPVSAPMAGRTVAEVAAEMGVDPVELLLDVVVPEKLPLTVHLPTLVPSLGVTDESWRRRAEIWRDRRVLIGGSDAGAHLDLMCHANYPTVVLGQAVRRRGVLHLEEAVRLMTDAPARLFGLRGRGRVEVGGHADLVVLDPRTVDTAASIARWDLPGGGERLYAEAVGIDAVLVGGELLVDHGQFTDARPGSVLRAGRDTDTVTAAGPEPR